MVKVHFFIITNPFLAVIFIILSKCLLTLDESIMYIDYITAYKAWQLIPQWIMQHELWLMQHLKPTQQLKKRFLILKHFNIKNSYNTLTISSVPINSGKRSSSTKLETKVLKCLFNYFSCAGLPLDGKREGREGKKKDLLALKIQNLQK